MISVHDLIIQYLRTLSQYILALQAMEEANSQKIQYNLLCQHNHQADLFCTNCQCVKSAYVCRNQSCTCFSDQHLECEFVNAKNILKKIQQKKKKSISEQTLKAIEKIQQIYTESIEKLSNDRQAVMVWKQNYGLNQNQINFIEAIQENNTKLVTGQLVSKVRQTLNEVQKHEWLNQQWVIEYWREQEAQFNQKFQVFTCLFKSNSKYVVPALDSLITTQAAKISNFFDNTVSKFQLLYRASENQFSVRQFHKNCDGIAHTVVLVQTNNGKVIGGYTPIPWEKTGQSFKQIQDSSGRSFLFSVSNNEKYPLINKSKALRHDSGHGPIFGGGSSDIFISGDSKRTSSSYFNFPGSYNNGKYTQSKESYLAFIGTAENYYTSLKQWEVFRVKFTKKATVKATVKALVEKN